MQIRFVKKQQEQDTVWSFFFAPTQKFSWQPGQYLYCTLPHQNTDNRGNSRYFTIASAPQENIVRFTTRYFGEQSSSFKRALFNLTPDSLLQVYPPDGSFVINNLSLSYLCLAGGIGITPFRSQISHFNHQGKFPNLILLYANSTPQPVFSHEFDVCAQAHSEFRVSYCISPEMIAKDYILKHAPDYANRLIYISGPEPMVKNMAATFQSLAVPKRQIKTDYFPGYQN